MFCEEENALTQKYNSKFNKLSYFNNKIGTVCANQCFVTLAIS